MIKKGTFASKGLPKSINDYFTANAKGFKDVQIFIDNLFIKVLDSYDFSSNSGEINSNNQENNKGIIEPQIVLTQSFV